MNDPMQALTERANYYRDPSTCGYWPVDEQQRLTADGLRKAAYELSQRAKLLESKVWAIEELVKELEIAAKATTATEVAS